MSDRIAEIEAALAYELKFNASACAVSFHVDHIRYLIDRVRELEMTRYAEATLKRASIAAAEKSANRPTAAKLRELIAAIKTAPTLAHALEPQSRLEDYLTDHASAIADALEALEVLDALTPEPR